MPEIYFNAMLECISILSLQFTRISAAIKDAVNKDYLTNLPIDEQVMANDKLLIIVVGIFLTNEACTTPLASVFH